MTAGTTRWTVGAVEIERVSEPGFGFELPQDDATQAALRANESWLAPNYITDDAALRIGSSATIIRSEGMTIVVDPWLVFDGDDRAARNVRLIEALEATGTKASDVDVVAYTHIDGVGATGCFPNARSLLNAPEMDRAEAAEQAATIRAATQLELIDPPYEITSEVRLELAAGHSPSHVAVVVESGGELAVIAGHLFLHPAQVAGPEPRDGLDEDPTTAAATRLALLARLADAGGVLIGPLWADPGGGVVRRGERGYELAAPVR